MSRNSKSPLYRDTAGFTLVEMIVVLIIISVLALIAAPGWLSFMNNRRAEAGREQIFQLLRQAQDQAIRSRQTQVVNFINTTNPPTVQALGTTQELDDGRAERSPDDQPFLGLQVINSSGPCAANAAGCVIFDEKGNIKHENNNLGDNDGGIKIVVTSPPEGGSKRCVIVRTLLGALAKGSGEDECS
ncbi:MAG: prepilin-type N-terminal cleavage/methylation domain-containing protein [Synechococcales cyanobacterium C42_A2020_086]|jgi:prepilin-type N-terminal cleavage/methylation domain-containing protein|nr:prepilin-type N-terminal cleavage/methylation domain-containing protein [Synechococcales cyanobacterium C42_A2020_086]